MSDYDERTSELDVPAAEAGWSGGPSDDFDEAAYYRERTEHWVRQASAAQEIAMQMADTLRGVLLAVDQEQPYPWDGGALKQQIREDITAYELLGLDGSVAPPRKLVDRED